MSEMEPEADGPPTGSFVVWHEPVSDIRDIPLSQDAYVYKPLSDAATNLRLLLLLPSSDPQAPLRAGLLHVERSNAPAFTPVSYTWGREDPTSAMYLIGLGPASDGAGFRRFAVRPNLESMLLRFRDRENISLLWVDAICINQADDAEKAHQVRHMDQVYRGRAARIWLGDRSETSDEALDFIDEWKNRPAAGDGSGKEFVDASAKRTSAWRALWDLICRPWFSRRWIVQEFVLSGYKHAYLGERDFPVDDLMPLVAQMDRFGRHLEGGLTRENRPAEDDAAADKKPVIAGVTPDRLESLKHLTSIAAASDRGEELTLEMLLDGFVSFESYDPRDGVYAFLSMASDARDWVPDYSAATTAGDVYARATWQVMRTSGSADVLCRAVPELSRRRMDMTSWVPWYGTLDVDDGGAALGYNTRSLTTFGQPLSAGNHGPWLGFGCDGCDEKIRGARYRCTECKGFDYCAACVRSAGSTHDPDHRFRKFPSAVYRASGGSTVGVGSEPSTLGGYIHLDGFVADAVAGFGPELHVLRRHNSVEINVPGADAAWAGVPGIEGAGPLTHLPDAFYRALTGMRLVRRSGGGRFADVDPPPENWIETARRILPVAEHAEETRLTLLCETDEDVLASAEFMLSGNRRFGVTENSMMAFLPRAAEPGDKICVLVGCSVPMVLRRVAQHEEDDNRSVWVLVGECYVDGLMEGMWYVQNVLRGGLEQRPFYIK